MSDPGASPSPSPATSGAATTPTASPAAGDRRELSAAARAQLQELFKRYPTREAALIPALHIAQREWGGWLPDAAIAAVAREVELPAAKVYGVVTFYDLLHQHQVGRHRLRICTNLPCMLRGSDEIMATVRQELGVGENEVTPDGRCSYVHFECLGSCDTAPMMMIDDSYHENLTPERVRQILGDLELMAAAAFEPVLTRNVGNPAALTLDGYRKSGGYEGLAKALKMEPDAVIDEVKRSGLRGRGGAGFSAGMKWSFIPKGKGKPKYLVCNADESEPGTFKDRLLMEKDPHQLIEGCAICCWAVQASTTYIYIRGEYAYAYGVMEQAIKDAYQAGILGDSVLGSGFKLDVYMHQGAGAYICGEETGMIESLEGKRGQPRVKPPFPAVVGAFGAPTVINNVETLANVPHIVTRGADWFKAIGTDERNTGPKLYAISGHVERPGTYETAIGIPFGELLELAGGMYRGAKLKAYIPGGASAAILTADQAHLALDFDTMTKAGSMLGSAAVMVMDDSTCMVRSVARLAKFFNHESCGQCTPCREGTNWLELLLTRIEHGEGRPGDPQLLRSVCKNMNGTALCALAEAAVGPVDSLIKRFPEEVDQHIRDRACPFPHRRYFSNGAS